MAQHPGEVVPAPRAASVIIPVHDAEKTLPHQLEALVGQQEASAFEVIVVLNRCADKSASVSHEFRDELDLRLLRADRQASAAYARNVGAAAAVAPILLFCDADDQVRPVWVSRMVDALTDGGADFVGGRICVNREGLPDWIYEWRHEWMDGRCLFETDSLPYAISAALGVRAEAFAAVGGFDEAFGGAGYEEVDLALRLLRRGFRIGEAERAVLDYSPRTSLRSALRQERSYARGQATIRAKQGTLGPALSHGAIAWGMLKMTARQVIRRREKRPQVVLAHVMSRYYALQEQRLRAAKATTQAQPQTQVDFLVPLTAPIIGGLAFSVTQAGEAAWYATEGIEQATLRIVDLLLPEGGRFVDCGANVGVFSVAAALKAGCNGTVVAFEPSPRAGAALATNLQRHGVADRVEVRQEAAGRKGEQKVFRQYENSLVSGFGEAPATSVPGEIVEESVVHVATLADLVRPPVDLLKIDVEGYEPEVLEGARTLISESPEIALLVEFNPAVLAAAGYSPADIFVHFPQDEWHLWIVDDQTLDADDPIRPIDLKSWTAGPIADAHWYGNLLAVRRDRATGMPGVHAGE